MVRYHQIFKKGRFPIKMPELCSSSKKGLVSQCLEAPVTVPFVNILITKFYSKLQFSQAFPTLVTIFMGSL